VTPKLRKLARRSALVTIAVTTTLLVAVPAHADVPEGWSDPEPVDPLHALLILAGIPLLLFVVITAAVYVPSLMRGERVAPGTHALESHWFGGPRKGTHELESGKDSADTGETGETGGASGRW